MALRAPAAIGAALLSLAAAVSAHAASYYVATTGSDGYTCVQAQNQSTPKATVPGGVACLTAAGDRLTIKAGTYFMSGGTFINIPVDGTPNAYTTIQGDPSGPRPLLLGPGRGTGTTVDTAGGVRLATCYVTATRACAYIELSHLEASNIYEGIVPVCLNADGVKGPCAHHWRILNNKIHHTAGVAVFGPDYSLFRGNEFSHIGIYKPGYLPGMNTIYGTGSYSIVEKNVFHDSTHGVGIWSSVDPNHHAGVIVRDNVLYNMGRFDLNPWGAGANSASGIHINNCRSGEPGHLVYNNIIYDSGFTGVTGAGGTTPAGRFAGITEGYCYTGISSIFNNTVYNTIDPGSAAIGVGHSTILVRNNIAYQAGRGIVGGTQSNNLIANPLFVNAAARDFRLQAGSPAINAGANLYSQGVTTDFSGAWRPQSGNFEIGAFEFGSGTPVANAAPAKVRGLRWR